MQVVLLQTPAPPGKLSFAHGLPCEIGTTMQKAVADIIADPKTSAPAAGVAFPVLIALSFCHMLNDMMQSLISALYPMLKADFNLDFTQIGLITLTFQLTAALLQPLVGMYTDRRPQPYSLAVGMGSTLVGLVLLSVAHSYPMVLFSAAMVGVGSSVFHPESSRVARAASGGRYGLAQSLFQVGGTPARRSARCWRHWWCCRAGRAPSPGSPAPPCWACSC